MLPGLFDRWYVDPMGSDAGPGGKWFKVDLKQSVALLKTAGYDESKKLDFKTRSARNYYVRGGYGAGDESFRDMWPAK